MRIELHSPGRKLLFAVLCLGLTAAYVYRAGRAYLVSRALDSADPNLLERAVRREPGNAEAWYRLGRVRSVLLQDVPGSVAPLQRAVALDPRHARYWLDLGLAYQYMGDSAGQSRAVANAVRLDSHDPDIAWEAGNFYLIAGDTRNALTLFRATLEGDPTFRHESSAILLSLRATNNDFLRVLDEVLPRDPRFYLDLGTLAVNANRLDAADQIWSRMISLGMHVNVQSAARYFASLIERNDSTRARSAWNDLAKIAPELQPYSYSDNLVVNGRFENNVLNAGFDWHYNRNDAAPLEIDSAGVHGGNHALMISFTGQPVQDLGLRQIIPVQGLECYQFSGFLRTSELEGVGGPQFRLSDLKTGHAYAQLGTAPGTHGWEERRQTFRTDPATHFLELRILHDRPETTVRGRVWADDLRLERVPQEACR